MLLLLRNLMLYGLLLVAVGVGVRYLAKPEAPRVYLPAYECVVPSDIPPSVSFRTADGGTEIFDLHAEYRIGHREGWDEYLAAFVHNRCGRKLRRPRFGDLDVPFRQESSARVRGRNDGHDACLQAIAYGSAAGDRVCRPFADFDPASAKDWDDHWRFSGDYRFADRQD